MLEHVVVQAGDVDQREDGDEAEYDRAEEEAVRPDVDEPLGEVLLGARLHHEEGKAHVDDFPRQEEREPGHGGEASGAGTEDKVASVGRLVAVGADGAITPAVKDEREGSKTESGNPKTVNEHVEDDLDGENTALELRFVSINAKSQSQQGKLTF